MRGILITDVRIKFLSIVTLQEAPGAVHYIVHVHTQYRAYRREKSLGGLQMAYCSPVVT